MTTKIGFHISSATGATSGYPQRFNSTAHLVLAVGIGGEVPRLLQVAEACPTARIIYRAWSYGILGASDHFENYYKAHGTDPTPLIRAHEPVFQAAGALNHRISYQLWNETGHDEQIWPHFIEFNRRYVEEMDRRGLSAAVLGLGPGHPAWPNGREGIRRAWFAARPLFEAINAAQQTHIINLHEYLAVPWSAYYPWIVGRFNFLLEDLATMGLLTDKIKIIVGESGYTNPNALNIPSPSGPGGYQWSLFQGHTPDQLAEDYVDMVRTVYDSSPHMVGLNYFCLGDSGGWREYDLLHEPLILERMLQMIEQTTWTVVPTPDTPFKVTADVLNVRFAPILAGQIIGKKLLNDVVTSNGYVDNDGIRWRQLVNSEGYCAERNLTSGNVYLEEVQPVPDWKVPVLAKIERIRQEITELVDMINQAPSQ